MAMKFKINKAAYDKLSDEYKGEYVAGDKDGEYVLDVSDLPVAEDTGPLKRALEKEKEKSKGLKSELDTAKASLADAPDVDKMTKDHEAATSKLTKFVDTSLRDAAATALATKISKAPALLKPIILARLQVDMTGDEPKTVILGADGKPDANLTIEKLSAELVANKDYAAIMIGSKATGGGAPKAPVNPLGGGAPKVDQSEDGKTPDLSAMKPDAFAERIAARLAVKAEANANSEQAA